MDLQNHKLGNMLAVTSGHSFDGRLSVLRSLRRLGVRVMALTSSCSNAWAQSYQSSNDTGLSAFGALVVHEMNRLGILIDLSEASYQTQIDVLNITQVPVVFLYGAALNRTINSRNIKDDVLEKLKINGGVVMVTFADQYISKTPGNSSISDVIEHINYIKKVVGASGVGIGAEFDAAGNTYPSALSDVSSFPVLFDELGKSWTRDDLKMLAGGNFLRVLQTVEQHARDSASLPADETYTLQINSSCYTDYQSRENVEAGTTTSPTASTPTTQPSTPTTQPSTPTTQPTTQPTSQATTTTVLPTPAPTTTTTITP